MSFVSKQPWSNQHQIFDKLLDKNHLVLPGNAVNLFYRSPVEFDKIVLDYQVNKTIGQIDGIKNRIYKNTFEDSSIGELIVDSIDWAIFHRQVFPAFSSAQILQQPIEKLSDFLYCYAFLVVGPTQLLDDRLDNPFKPELDLRIYKDNKSINLWAISDLMIRKGTELFLKYSPQSFLHISPLTFDMTYSMYKENKVGAYNLKVLNSPNMVLSLYAGDYPPDMSSIFNETMFVGAAIHLREKNINPFISLSKKFRLLRQQLNELEDFILDLLCGYIKKPAAILLSDKDYGEKFKALITNQIWTNKNLTQIEKISLELSQVDFYKWISNQYYCKEIIDIFNDSGVAENLYHQIDKLCYAIAEEIEGPCK